MIHERFAIEQWKPVFTLTDSIDGEVITSPYDIVAVETIRERALQGRHVGSAIPTDICIMAKGEPTNRAITKIGGLPYWPTDTPWPCGAYGRPLVFVAQFNFADSKDITGPLPGDILVFFAGDDTSIDFDKDSDFHLAWFPLDQRFTLIGQTPATEWEIDPCYGQLYRTVDYPEVERDAFSIYSQSYLVASLAGTKIGGVPQWIQHEEPMPGRFLGSICSVQPAFAQPYPFVNTPELITAFAELHGTKDLMIGDMGSYYFFLDDTGQVHVTAQCY